MNQFEVVWREFGQERSEIALDHPAAKEIAQEKAEISSDGKAEVYLVELEAAGIKKRVIGTFQAKGE